MTDPRWRLLTRSVRHGCLGVCIVSWTRMNRPAPQSFPLRNTGCEETHHRTTVYYHVEPWEALLDA